MLMATVACAGADGPGNGSEWVLNKLDGKPFDARATLVFSGPGQIGGRAPCNGFGGSFAGPWPQFSVGPLISTKMACPELDAEFAYLQTLEAMTSGRLEDGVLVLTGPAGRSLEFTSEDAD